MDYLTIQHKPSKDKTKATIEQLREAYFSGKPLNKAQRRLARELNQQLCGTSNGYIAPRIRQVDLRKLGKSALYDIQYIIEDEFEDGYQEVRIFSDTTNLTPRTIRRIAQIQNTLKSKATDSEKYVKEILNKIPGIHYSFQKPFCICERIFFADFYIHATKTIIEVDGGIHNIPTKKLKDTERTAYLNSVGIQVVRISNAEVLSDSVTLYNLIAPHIILKRGRVANADDIKHGIVCGRKKKCLVKAIEPSQQNIKKPLCQKGINHDNKYIIKSLRHLRSAEIRNMIFTYRKTRLQKQNKYEKAFSQLLTEAEIEFYFCMPFYINERTYYSDFYIPNLNVVVSLCSEYKPFDNSQNARLIDDFNSCGIKHLILNIEQIYQPNILSQIVKQFGQK